MQYLVPMRIVPEGRPMSVEEGEAFFREFIRPTLELCSCKMRKRSWLVDQSAGLLVSHWS